MSAFTRWPEAKAAYDNLHDGLTEGSDTARKALAKVYAGTMCDLWSLMSPRERDQCRDVSGLTPQLLGLEGWRVEVIDHGAEIIDGSKGLLPRTRRFIVGRSTGWRPCHLEIARRTSSGGGPARTSYADVRRIEKVR